MNSNFMFAVYAKSVCYCRLFDSDTPAALARHTIGKSIVNGTTLAASINVS